MEILKDILPLVQIILSVSLIALILLQRSGAELGGAFGGGDGSGGMLYTRRGIEKTLFIITILLGVLFVAASFGAFLLG